MSEETSHNLTTDDCDQDDGSGGTESFLFGELDVMVDSSSECDDGDIVTTKTYKTIKALILQED